MKQILIPLCISLLVLLLLIHPVIFLNDEWITTNQLSQLSEHKQILTNEGKYGTYPNGTPFDYFIEKENLLPYTSFLPILAYPVFILTKITGDILPYYASVLVSLLLLILALIIKNKSSQKTMSVLLIGIAFAALLLNITFFRPFQVTTENAPVEILAVVVTHIFIFLILVLVIHAIMKALFPDPNFAMFGLLATIACSSYLFWTITCKDHLDVALVVGIMILCLIRFVKSNEYWFLFSTFLTTGILTWIRPNYGPVLFFFLLIMVVYWIITTRKERTTSSCLVLFLTPIGTLIGLIPLFINNLCVTGHPVVFPFQMVTRSTGTQYDSFIEIPTGSPPDTGFVLPVSGIAESIQTIIHLLLARVVPNVPTETAIHNYYAVFISPTTLKVPVLALVPIFLLGLYFLPALLKEKTMKLKTDEKRIIIFMFVLVLGTICAYLTTIGALDSSIGIYPDVRYLSPIYIPLNVIGLIFLSHILTDTVMIKRVVNYALVIAISACCGMPFILGWLYRMSGFWDIFLWTNGIVTIVIYGLLLLSLFLVYGWYTGRCQLQALTIPLAFLVAVPLIWQVTLIMLTNFSIGDPYHYPPLLPMIRELFVWLQG